MLVESPLMAQFLRSFFNWIKEKDKVEGWIVALFLKLCNGGSVLMKLAQKKRINLDVAFIAWKAVSFFLNIYHFFFWGFEYFFIRFVQVHQRLEELRKTLVVTINIVSIVGSEKRIRETETESLDFFLEKDREFGWY